MHVSDQGEAYKKMSTAGANPKKARFQLYDTKLKFQSALEVNEVKPATAFGLLLNS
jgi:hypothetical protein